MFQAHYKICICLLKQSRLQAQLSQKEIILVDSLIIDLNIPVNLKSIFCVFHCLVVHCQLSLAHR